MRYDNLGRRDYHTLLNGNLATWTRDPFDRVTQITHNLAGSGDDLTLDFTHNPAGQIATSTRDDDDYAWTGHKWPKVIVCPTGRGPRKTDTRASTHRPQVTIQSGIPTPAGTARLSR